MTIKIKFVKDIFVIFNQDICAFFYALLILYHLTQSIMMAFPHLRHASLFVNINTNLCLLRH